MSKTIILCADDFALSKPISQGILDLIQQQRLSAVSCMTQSPLWPEYAQQLLPFAKQVDIGLHFNLTEDFGQGALSLPQLMSGALLQTLDLAAIKNTLQEQLQNFETLMGRMPDFVDGHQHIHTFKGIRKVFLECIAERYPLEKPYLRSVSTALFNHDAPLKALVLRGLAAGFEKQARHCGFSVPTAFAGMYSLNAKADFPKLLKNWLKTLPSQSLIMCHPGLIDTVNKDAITQSRQHEFNYLNSEDFQQFLTVSAIKLTQFVK